MARRARLRAAGIPWHIIQRGVDRCACFRDDEDRELYLGLVAELSAKDGCDIHAYVLMTNHVHLLMTPLEAESPSRFMKHLGERYVPHYNKRHSRTGTLWQGRFKSSLIDTHTYLLTCHRYIEMNPVRAGMVRHPVEYPWCSYATHAQGRPSLFLKRHPALENLGPSEAAFREAYRASLAETIAEDELERIRKASNGGLPLGSADFVRRLEAELGRRTAPGGLGGRPRRRDAVIEAIVW